MEPRFADALCDLHKLLPEASLDLQIPIRFALIGGLAMSAWGVVRATEDIDFLADSSPSPIKNLVVRRTLQKLLEARGYTADWRVGATDDPIPLLLRVGAPRLAHGPGMDILWAHKRWQREALERTIALRLTRAEVFVLHPEDLVLMKLEAGGPQDLLDVETLLSSPPQVLDLKRLKKKAVQLRLAAQLERCLQESRGRRK